jgi:hypothetical protein
MSDQSDATLADAGAGEGEGGEGKNNAAAAKGAQTGATPLGAEKTSGKPEAKAEGADGANDEGKDGAGSEGDPKEGGDEPTPVDLSTLVIPEGFTANEEWMGKFGEHPLIQKASQEEAQSMVDMAAEFVSGVREQIEQGIVAQQNQRVADWTKAIEAHDFVVKEGGLEKIIPLAIAARDALFGDLPEFNDLIQALNESGLGAHPAMVVGLAKAAKALELAEGVPLGSGAPKVPGGAKRIEDKLFPNYAEGGRYA